MNLLNEQTHDEDSHQTRSWSNLNKPRPGSGAAEQKVLRALIEKNSVKANRQNRFLNVYVLPGALLMLTAFVAYQSFAANNQSNRQFVIDNPALETPRTSKEFSNRAEALVQLGRFDEALMDYSCLLKLNRHSKRAHEGIALCYFETGRNTEAIEKLNSILSKYPDSISAHMMRGECFRNMHEFDKARADFSWLLQHDKNCPNAYCSMADLLVMEDKREEALIYLDSAISSKNDNFDTRQRRADILVSLGRFADAEKDFEEINKMTDKQENASTLASRSKAYMAMGNYDKALPVLDKLITLRPKHVTPYMERAKAHFGLRNFSKAMKDCNKVLALSKDNPDALTLRADCNLKFGDDLAAQHDYQQAVAKNPKFTEGILKLASFQMSQSNFASALASYRNALQNEPNCNEAATGCRRAQRALESLAGDSQIAFAASQNGWAAKTADEDETKELATLGFSEVLEKGYAALRDGRCQFACRALKRAVLLQPNSAEARRYLAFALMEIEDVSNAEKQLQALKQLNREEPSDNVRLATAFQKAGNHEKAIEILQKHVRQHRTDVDAIVLLTDSFITANDRERAIKLCEQALRLVSSPRDQERLREKYTALKNSDQSESGANSQRAIEASPIESRGS